MARARLTRNVDFIGKTRAAGCEPFRMSFEISKVGSFLKRADLKQVDTLTANQTGCATTLYELYALRTDDAYAHLFRVSLGELARALRAGQSLDQRSLD